MLFFVTTAGSCFSIKKKQITPTLLDVSNASHQELLDKINHFAKVDSMRAKMDLQLEDNSYAKIGQSEKYRNADGEVVVQRPANILLKIKVPVIKTEVAQMTSDGEKFQVAILQDGSGGKYKKFVTGTNSEDYSLLQERVVELAKGESADLKKNVNAFANIRPHHFTDAMLVRPVDEAKYLYTKSTVIREEVDFKQKKKSPLYWVLRGYYLLDEFRKDDDGSTKILRRFWFDRVGGARLARQQIFDKNGEIESDIVYGRVGALSEQAGYTLPLLVEVTRPKEKYKMTLKYQAPKTVSIGKKYKAAAFVLKNRWNLEELDLDKKLSDVKNGKNQNSVLEQ
ncbi:MAG: hypothetical protein HKN25_09080 [Pyrinomonadaceae bacterium]|nr:hypothetical protein [Pyrinomonadaceae bacterium]